MSRKETAGFFIAGIIFAIVLVFVLRLKLIDTAQAIQITISFVLVLVTAIYVKRTADIAKATKEQADASVKIARETKDARFAALKPIVMMDWSAGAHGHAVSTYFENIGLGPALNVKCYYTHTKFEFKSKQDRTTLVVGKREHITLLSEDFDFKDWAGFAINCDYQSIYGENFRSILGFKTEQERNLEILELK